MKKKALITGITGQDGSYLAELLLGNGYEVHGMVRRVALEDPDTRLGRINHIKDDLHLHPGSLESYSSILDLFEKIKPAECYHLASQSFVHESFEDAFSTFNTNINGTLHVLSALQKKCRDCKFYFAGSSEMFGLVEETPQTEKTKFHPRSPYGITKTTGFEITRNYRESHDIFACSGILFNHESERRGGEFVTKRITRAVSKASAELDNVIILGNLDAKRDWGHAEDYVRAMWMMLQQEKPDDYVIATGKNHTIQDFLDAACDVVGLDYELAELHTTGLSREKAIESANRTVRHLRKLKHRVFVVQHPSQYRPAEVHALLGNYSKAKKVLGWEPTINFNQLVKRMVLAEKEIKEAILNSKD
jgi:GDPmannose 4,6-dehydratase